MRYRPLLVALLAPIAALVAACGAGTGDPSDGSASARESSAKEAFPAVVAGPAGEVRVERRPRRIVSLSPTATESLFAIGAGDQVIAVDDNSSYPKRAPTTSLSGYETNVEAVAAYEPDLVVYANDPGDLQSSLDKLGIPALLQPAPRRLEGAYRQIEQLGVATGHAAEAAGLIASMKSDIDGIAASVPEFSTKPSYYHELDDTYFTVTSETFIGQVYALLGLRNIADRADEQGTGYPQLSAEYIISADPDLIFLADTRCCDQTAEEVARRPGWGSLAAVRNGTVAELDDDIASRWGPRVVDFLRAAAGALRQLKAATA
jgi:iron complex transport system substrate-binding protein